MSLCVGLFSNEAEESLLPLVISTVRYAVQWVLMHDALHNKPEYVSTTW
jgi:hypothetical protein